MEPTRSEGQPAQPGVTATVARACKLDPITLDGLFPHLERPTVTWVENDGWVVAGGASAWLTGTGSDRFADVETAATRLFDAMEVPEAVLSCARPRVFGGFSFTDTHDDSPSEPWEGFPGASFVLPAVQIARTDTETWLTVTARGPTAIETATARLERWRNRLSDDLSAPSPSPPGIDSLTYSPEREQWRHQVTAAIDRIRAGELEKVVLANAVTAELEARPDIGHLLTRLGSSYPDCYRFAFTPETGGTFFGATPERLVRVSEDRVQTEALAGSIGRGDTTAEDEWLTSQLRQSDKNNHEHDIVVEAIREQLETLTDGIDTGDRGVRRLANVQHLETPITARRPSGTHVLSLVEALHPTPAVGGLPPGDALATIRDTEAFDRGWYAAPVGWFDADGNGEFAVAIRSAVAADRTVTAFAGAGIVEDSDPDEEWDELQLKYRPILDALA